MSERYPIYDNNYNAPAVIAVDIQKDFLPGGSLAVPGGDEIVEPMNRIDQWRDSFFPSYLAVTRDWHPRDTAHFAEYGGKWPPHCVQGTEGAELHPDLFRWYDGNLLNGTVYSKGMSRTDDEYSGWHAVTEAYGRKSSVAEDIIEFALEREKFRRRLAVFVGGVATEVCLRSTVLDALNDREKSNNAYDVFVLTDAIRAINPADGDRAIREMAAAGAYPITTDEVVNGAVKIHFSGER